MTTQTAKALSLVPSSNSKSRVKIKRESKSEIIARLEAAQKAQLETIESYKGLVQTRDSKIQTLENPEQSEVVENVKTAFRAKNRLASFWGLIKGGWAPLASFDIVHNQLGMLQTDSKLVQLVGGIDNLRYILLSLVGGALLFSAPNVFQWCKAAYNSSAKALGFVILVEGVLVFGQSSWLSYSALALLIIINGIQSACNLAIRQKKNEFQF